MGEEKQMQMKELTDGFFQWQCVTFPSVDLSARDGTEIVPVQLTSSTVTSTWPAALISVTPLTSGRRRGGARATARDSDGGARGLAAASHTVSSSSPPTRAPVAADPP
ncbi:hypothetical protein E2562_003768 [Oryza meyeriana var. granulata]|uniref:Uncharacterized protein n=1 Tax=Oryza meyeriana var. granulata TaxID=110450 RepID=A0A6G1BRR3_9ORYZ|nr:hypothetical protein E2562_003768 [Oryza meyeriana var. granulata]